MSEEPLHWRVAKALGWVQIELGNMMNLNDPGVGYPPRYPVIGHKEPVPRFDEDWGAVGPVVDRYVDAMAFILGSGKAAGMPQWDDHYQASAFGARSGNPHELTIADGRTAPEAVCNLILALHASGHLGPLMEAK